MKPATAKVIRRRSGLAVLSGNALDIVGRVAVGGLGDPIERSLDLVESEQERAGQRRNSGHVSKPSQATLTGPYRRPLPSGKASHRAVGSNMGSCGKRRKNAGRKGARLAGPPLKRRSRRLSRWHGHSIDRAFCAAEGTVRIAVMGREGSAAISARGSRKGGRRCSFQLRAGPHLAAMREGGLASKAGN